MFYRLCYDGALLLYFLFSLPKFLLERIRYGKYRKSFLSRFLGRGPKHVRSTVLWFHAVSVGEVKALSTLIPLFRNAFPHSFIVVSTVTETGQQQAVNLLTKADAFCYLPFDFSFSVSRFVRRLKPDLLVLVEGDYWFNLLRETKKWGGKIAVASGKISLTSLQRYAKIPIFSRKLFSLIDHFCLQNIEYANRFRKLNIGFERITVSGNLKFDISSPTLSSIEKEKLQKQLGISSQSKAIIVGSTHAEEEYLLLKALFPLLKKCSLLKFVLLPRHPERFLKVHAHLQAHAIPHVLFSSSSPKESVPVILVDKMGILPACYSVGHLAIVGGSYVPGIGGHDVFEPIKAGIPVFFGPYMESQLELKTEILQAGAGKQTILKELAREVEKILWNHEEREKMIEKGKKLTEEKLGASQQNFAILQSLLPEEEGIAE